MGGLTSFGKIADNISESVLVIPIYSMRNKMLGTLPIFIDGNFKTMMQILKHDLSIGKNTKVDILCMSSSYPYKDIALEIGHHVTGLNLSFINEDGLYGYNAFETRNNALDYNLDELCSNYDKIICELPMLINHPKVVYNWNYGKMEGLNENTYPTNFFKRECEILQSGVLVNVMNYQQVDSFRKEIGDNYRLTNIRILSSNIFTSCDEYADGFINWYNNLGKRSFETTFRIKWKTIMDDSGLYNNDGLSISDLKIAFIPHRLDNPTYRVEEIIGKYNLVFLANPSRVRIPDNLRKKADDIGCELVTYDWLVDNYFDLFGLYIYILKFGLPVYKGHQLKVDVPHLQFDRHYGFYEQMQLSGHNGHVNVIVKD